MTTPNNPDGKQLSPRHLEQLAELARRHDLWVLADEVYEDLAYAAPHVSIAALPGMAERTLTVFSLSKSYAIAGHRLGYVVGAAAPMHALRKIANHTVYNVPSLLAARGARARRRSPSSRAWLDETRALYRARATRPAGCCPRRTSSPTARPTCSSICRAARPTAICGRSSSELLDAGVSIAPGEQFGRDFARHARICFTAVPVERLRVGLARLASVLSASLRFFLAASSRLRQTFRCVSSDLFVFAVASSPRRSPAPTPTGSGGDAVRGYFSALGAPGLHATRSRSPTARRRRARRTW